MNNLNTRYRMMAEMGETAARLPSKYQEVEYIEAPDNNYVYLDTKKYLGIPLER